MSMAAAAANVVAVQALLSAHLTATMNVAAALPERILMMKLLSLMDEETAFVKRGIGESGRGENASVRLFLLLLLLFRHEQLSLYLSLSICTLGP